MFTNLDYLEPSDFSNDESNDYVHIDELTKFEDASSLLKEIIKHVYITGNLDDFEDSLDELCDVYSLKIPYSKPILKGQDVSV